MLQAGHEECNLPNQCMVSSTTCLSGFLSSVFVADLVFSGVLVGLAKCNWLPHTQLRTSSREILERSIRSLMIVPEKESGYRVTCC